MMGRLPLATVGDWDVAILSYWQFRKARKEVLRGIIVEE
jgi:hypothetical protein